MNCFPPLSTPSSWTTPGRKGFAHPKSRPGRPPALDVPPNMRVSSTVHTVVHTTGRHVCHQVMKQTDTNKKYYLSPIPASQSSSFSAISFPDSLASVRDVARLLPSPSAAAAAPTATREGCTHNSCSFARQAKALGTTNQKAQKRRARVSSALSRQRWSKSASKHEHVVKRTCLF